MKKNRWSRPVALALVLAMLVTAVAALSFDLNGDGKTNVWDLQMAINQGKTQEEKAAALKEALGDKGDELHPNAEGVYEIWSSVGLYNMARHSQEGATFVLKADVDLKGADWTPIPLKGTFDGKLHTISNVNITKSVPSTYKTTDDMGFFSIVDNYKVDGAAVQSVVKNLNLENVHITATEQSVFLGLIAGSNRGRIENCTVTGVITDNRTTLPAKTYVGAFVGRNNDSTPPGTVSAGANLLTLTDEAGNKTTGLSARVAMQLTELSYPEGTEAAKQYNRSIGIAGASNVNNIDTSMIWQDTTNDSAFLSKTEQQRREAVEERMYQMGTVKWTPSETVTYTRYSNGQAQPSHIHSSAYLAGETYTGIPYVGGHNGSYERFLSQMQAEKDDQGRYVTVTGLENGARKSGESTGMSRYIGNNCSQAVVWAWAAVSPSHVNTQADGSQYGGAKGIAAYFMVPTAYNIQKNGVRAVGGYQVPESNTEKFKEGIDARDTATIIALNGVQTMAECYADAHKGDTLIYAEYAHDQKADTYTYVNSHSRLVAADPVIIRNYKTTIDLERSYVLTHEQGDGLNDNKDNSGKWLKTYKDAVGTYNVKYTSWRIHHKYTLSVLLTEEGHTAAKNAADEAKKKGTFVNGMQPGCGYGYVPITIPAYTLKTEKAPYFTTYESHPISLPSSGWYYSNYWIIDATMTILDAEGRELYNKTIHPVDHTNSYMQTLMLEKDFPDADDQLVAGQTYKCVLKVTSSNGKVTYIGKDATESSKPVEVEFTYTPVTENPGEELPEDGTEDE